MEWLCRNIFLMMHKAKLADAASLKLQDLLVSILCSVNLHDVFFCVDGIEISISIQSRHKILIEKKVSYIETTFFFSKKRNYKAFKIIMENNNNNFGKILFADSYSILPERVYGGLGGVDPITDKKIIKTIAGIFWRFPKRTLYKLERVEFLQRPLGLAK
ncbi:MAG: hypothetical protein ACXWM7_04525 [Parachlamydiaceae bacterium]